MPHIEEKNSEEITRVDIDSLLGREENQRLDFKETLGTTPNYEIAKDLACFANAEGGLIVYGAVEDRSTTKCVGFKSVTDPESLRKKIEQVAIDRVQERLPLSPRIATATTGEVLVLVLIPKGRKLRAVKNEQGNPEYWKRFGRDKRIMTHAEMQADSSATEGDSRTEETLWSSEWVSRHGSSARAGLKQTDAAGYFESYLDFSQRPELCLPQPVLLRAAAASAVARTGYWPIGKVLSGRGAPQVKADEIVTMIPDSGSIGFGTEIPYTYWALNNRTEFYTLVGYNEDLDHKRGSTENRFLFVRDRLCQATELLLYGTRLFQQLKVLGSGRVSSPATATFRFHYAGLKGRLLGPGGVLWKTIDPHQPSTEGDVFSTVSESTELLERELDKWLPQLVERLTSSLFGLFWPFEIKSDEYSTMVLNWRAWLEGRIR